VNRFIDLFKESFLSWRKRDNGADVMRLVLIAALVTVGLMACRSTLTRSLPRYVVTGAPIAVGISPPGLCIAVDPNDARGVWWWEPGRSGCSSRSTGPGVFRGDDARVTRAESGTTDIYFRLQLITGPNEGPRFADVRLALRNTDIRSIPSGMQVSIERRRDLEVPEEP
jgi:hypothetical protein